MLKRAVIENSPPQVEARITHDAARCSILKLSTSPEARPLAEMLAESKQKRRTLVALAFDTLPTVGEMRWLLAESPERLRAVLALQTEKGLKQGVIVAALEHWPDDVPVGRDQDGEEERMAGHA